MEVLVEVAEEEVEEAGVVRGVVRISIERKSRVVDRWRPALERRRVRLHL